MSLQEFPDMEQRSDEWLAARCGMVTASVIGSLITTKTLKPADNETSRSLLRLLVAERITGQAEDTYQSDDMWRGRMLEPFARDLYSKHFTEAHEYGFMVREHPEFSVGASPDGLVGEHGGIEIKCPRAKNHLETILDDEVPARYVAQVQCSLYVSGRDFWDYVSYCPGLPLYVKRVLPDQAWFDAIAVTADSFEVDATKMIAAYYDRVRDLVPTEPVDLDNIGVDLKL